MFAIVSFVMLRSYCILLKQFSNGLTTMLQKEYYNGLTVEGLITKDTSAELPEPSKFMKRHYCTQFFDLIYLNMWYS